MGGLVWLGQGRGISGGVKIASAKIGSWPAGIRSWLKGEELIEVEAEKVVGEALASKVDKFSEVTKELEGRVVGLEEERKRDMESVASLQKKLEEAITEMAKSNDLLVQEQTRWLATIKKYEQASRAEATPLSTPTLSDLGVEIGKLDSGKEAELPGDKININSATLAQLDSLPGIGATYAQRIIDYREEKGAFKSKEEVMKVSGIGTAMYEKIKDLIEV